ncbi:UTRA domain-containing protein [Micromonospora sp. NPDC049900]|uniref:UTRA domain-containing protein n=1 Tax=unclassified Micromonospora TaxID=2617518 RepID=UPI0037B2BBC9
MSEAGWLSVSMPYLRPRPDQHGDAWAADAAQQGGVGTQRLLHVGEVVPAAAIAAALGVEEGTPAVVRRRLILLDDQPVELTDSYYPVTIARDTALAEPRKIRGGAIRLLAELGYVPKQATEDVYTREPEAAERQVLDLTDGEWVLGLTRVLTTHEGVPIEVSVMTMTPAGRRLRYQMSLD